MKCHSHLDVTLYFEVNPFEVSQDGLCPALSLKNYYNFASGQI